MRSGDCISDTNRIQIKWKQSKRRQGPPRPQKRWFRHLCFPLPLSDFENFSGLSVTHPKSALPLNGVVAVRSEEGERGRAINGVCAVAFAAASTNTSYRRRHELVSIGWQTCHYAKHLTLSFRQINMVELDIGRENIHFSNNRQIKSRQILAASCRMSNYFNLISRLFSGVRSSNEITKFPRVSNRV